MKTSRRKIPKSSLSWWRRSVRLTIFIAIAAPSSGFAKEIAIVHANNPISTVSPKNLKKILLGKTKKWNNGTKIVITRLSGGAVHDKFIKTFAQKTSKQFTNYWRKMLFSGKGRMPKLFQSENALANFVAQNEGAIGYIDSTNVVSGVKALTIE